MANMANMADSRGRLFSGVASPGKKVTLSDFFSQLKRPTDAVKNMLSVQPGNDALKKAFETLSEVHQNALKVSLHAEPQQLNTQKEEINSTNLCK